MADLDELRATFEQLGEAYNAHNVELLLASMHEEVVIFSASSPFPVMGKTLAQHYFRMAFSYYEKTTTTPINPQFRVLGTTGIVWGHAAITLKPIDGPVTTIYTRQTWAFTKVGEKWLVAAVHQSRLPSGN